MNCEYCGAPNATDAGNMIFQCEPSCCKAPMPKTERYMIIDECLTELSKYAYTSFAFSVIRRLQEK